MRVIDPISGEKASFRSKKKLLKHTNKKILIMKIINLEK